jgi:hypothetical protein
MQDITCAARIPGPPTVARMFFQQSAWNQLFDAIQQQMQRDYSPTCIG